MARETRSFLDRKLRQFLRAWPLVGGLQDWRSGLAPDLPDEDLALLRKQIDACLQIRGGEVSARSRAAELGKAYLELNRTGRRRFLSVLAREYGADPDRVEEAARERLAARTADEIRRAEARLRRALVPARVELLTRFNSLPRGVKFLVDLRADLLELEGEDPALGGLDADLRHLLASWFDVGFLDLERITWSTSAALLEKLIDYEAVHAIRSWQDLKNRLDSDRRCYAFFHPSMPDEPLIFVEVALTTGMADDIRSLLDEGAPADDPRLADTAVFYSISNCQRGLAGISFGSFLIKQVVDALSHELPNIETFVTLSPIPDFGRWLEEAPLADLLTEDERARVERLAGSGGGAGLLPELLQRPGWERDEQVVEAVRSILLRLCARYLLEERRDGEALDRVARFHLANGARVERINWMADPTPRGLAQSAGMMVNYRYELDRIEQNHEAYTGRGRVAASQAVERLARG